MSRTLALILAGGEGRRLEPLTRDRAKPAVPFGSRYRIIDFALSNFANSGVLKIKVLTQYKSDSLNRHITRGWRLAAMLDNYVETVPAQMRTGPEWFKGSADAVYQNLNLITDEEPDFVFVFGADHVYRMDVRQMLHFHRETGADCTVAAIPMPVADAPSFGVIEMEPNGRMVGFQEKPKVEAAKTMPSDPTRILASMGNYIFTTDALVREIVRDAGRESAHDFGKSIISEMYKHSRVFVYDFAQNSVPGQGPKERGYWRDVGEIETYYRSNLDLVEVDPVFNLYNDRWPIFTAQHNYPPAKFVFADRESERVGMATDSLISEGCILSGGSVHRCVLSPQVRINSYSQVEESILFERVDIGRRCRIRKAIIDKNVEIPPGTVIGYDPQEDRRRFHVTSDGIVVIPKGMRIEGQR
ncbi:glucose-1-phosphate adenylyltransferase [Vulgatibacter incomptus]|uniref:Glucose-1-phosphate adenylyltransferase n=1 Tax=Vulgatibacter incomptus TaxID=1391653 RepID=A0A0K1P950_9BACT|nr:glucose-1-phosphate adenylyltransferase [Vulgatibacter incomptus]AKU89634.1 Glucose-1-phosphate adenylyltransferase [Vulgatibacter incomptus]